MPPDQVADLHYVVISLYNAAMAGSDARSQLLDVAADQWGLVTRQQAQSTGMAWSTLARMVDTGAAERRAHGVYRLRGAPEVDLLDLRAAWLQLSPAEPAWRRTVDSGVVSHRSAAALYGLGHLAANAHEFILPTRRQTRRSDVRLHKGKMEDSEWAWRGGLPVTRPHRIAADLLRDREDPESVGHVVADALRGALDLPVTMAQAMAPYGVRYGLSVGDGAGLMTWLLELAGDPELVATRHGPAARASSVEVDR